MHCRMGGVDKNKEVHCWTGGDEGIVTGDSGARPKTVGDIPQRKLLRGAMLELQVLHAVSTFGCGIAAAYAILLSIV